MITSKMGKLSEGMSIEILKEFGKHSLMPLQGDRQEMEVDVDPSLSEQERQLIVSKLIGATPFELMHFGRLCTYLSRPKPERSDKYSQPGATKKEIDAQEPEGQIEQ